MSNKLKNAAQWLWGFPKWLFESEELPEIRLDDAVERLKGGYTGKKFVSWLLESEELPEAPTDQIQRHKNFVSWLFESEKLQ